MKFVISRYKQRINSIFCLLILTPLTFTLSGCFGGGSDDVAVEIEPTVPEVFNYDIKQSDGVTLTVDQGVNQATISSTLLSGSYNRVTEAFTLDYLGPFIMSVSAGDFLADLDASLSSDAGEPVNFSDYKLTLVSAAAWTGDSDLTSGVFDIYDDAVRKIRLAVNPDVGSGMAGVDITYWPFGDAGASQTTSVTWDELDSLYGNDSAETYARVASFAYSVLGFMYEQGGFVIDTLQYIGEVDSLLTAQGVVSESCDTYQLPVLPSVPDPTPGMSTFTWDNASLDGDLGGGDNFYWNFNQCWRDDDTDDIDLLLDGKLDMVNYVEGVTDDVITRIGFEPYVNTPGGVVYHDLKITETETTLANVILKNVEAVILNGGFSMVFTSP